jgi:hypothetical protein
MQWWQTCKRNQKIEDLLKSKFNGKMLVNLGAGNPSPFLEELNNGTIINVDRFSFGNVGTKKPIKLEKMWTQKKGEVKSFGVSADMLDFVSKLSDNSVNIEIDGIDYDIIHNPEYHKALAKEILRVTEKGGLMIGIHSNPLYFVKELDGIKRIDENIIQKE